MNRPQTEVIVRVMVAFSKGATIEYKRNVDGLHPLDWISVTTPSWNWDAYQYRVKPIEPREVFVNDHAGRLGNYAYPTVAEAVKRCPGAAAIKFREVIELPDENNGDSE